MSISQISDDPYQDIRPYDDDEVPAVLKRLANDAEFIQTLAQFKLPRLNRYLPGVTRWLIQRTLNGYLGRVSEVSELQQQIASYVEKTIKESTESLTYEGLENLDPSQGYLFLSNHRDIVMDPTLVNYSLYANGFPTARCATGDNLLAKPFIEDLMRVNKAFIVKRSIQNRREKMAALTKLSSYISDSIQSGNSIWIAHREGRSKDGIDLTDSAVLKMLQLGQRSQTKSFAEAMHNLKVVPVSISYQYDPCDQMKAKELEEKARKGLYTKAEGEDTQSIVRGILDNKGRVHIAFGKPLVCQSDDAGEVAQQIDRSMHRLYQLQDTNYAADALLKGQAVESAYASGHDYLRCRQEGLSEAQRQQLLQMYANPVINQQRADNHATD